jgi:hypothetical protein
MQSYELNTEIHDGIIRVPQQYLDKQVSKCFRILPLALLPSEKINLRQ